MMRHLGIESCEALVDLAGYELDISSLADTPISPLQALDSFPDRADEPRGDLPQRATFLCKSADSDTEPSNRALA